MQTGRQTLIQSQTQTLLCATFLPDVLPDRSILRAKLLIFMWTIKKRKLYKCMLSGLLYKLLGGLQSKYLHSKKSEMFRDIYQTGNITLHLNALIEQHLRHLFNYFQ